VFWDHEKPSRKTSIFPVCRSFTELLNKLYIDYEIAINRIVSNRCVVDLQITQKSLEVDDTFIFFQNSREAMRKREAIDGIVPNGYSGKCKLPNLKGFFRGLEYLWGMDFPNTGSFGKNPGGVRKRANPHHTREKGTLSIFEQTKNRLIYGNFGEMFGKLRRRPSVSRDSAPAVTMRTPQ